MAPKCTFSLKFWLLLISCVALVTGQDDNDCLPGLVRNLQLSGNSTLSWDPPLNENCEIQYYLIYVSIINTEEQYTYTVTETTMDVGHLTPCIRYYFQVGQVTAENVTGALAGIHTITPPPSAADLALEYLSVVPDGRNVRLEWSLAEEWLSCAERFRVVIVNEPSQTVTDIYTTSPSATVVGLTGCASYTFSVRAMFTLEEEGPTSVVRYVAGPANTSVPVVKELTHKHTGTTLTLELQSYESNRCPIQSINVDGGRYFNATFPVTDQAQRHTFKASVSNLQSDTMYYLKISATNTAGTTRPVLMAIQTLN